MIPGFSAYEAGTGGEIRFRATGRVRSNRALCHGYPRIRLRGDDGKTKTMAIHRLVATAFLGVPGDLHVNHINFCRTDNRVENLEYVTHAQNIAHSRNAGRYPCLRGQKRPNFKQRKTRLTPVQVEEIRGEKNLRVYELCRIYGVCGTIIERIKRGKYKAIA